MMARLRLTVTVWALFGVFVAAFGLHPHPLLVVPAVYVWAFVLEASAGRHERP